jgi:hypothetical protein
MWLPGVRSAWLAVTIAVSAIAANLTADRASKEPRQ